MKDVIFVKTLGFVRRDERFLYVKMCGCEVDLELYTKISCTSKAAGLYLVKKSAAFHKFHTTTFHSVFLFFFFFSFIFLPFFRRTLQAKYVSRRCLRERF